MDNTNICQSCSMPMDGKELWGTEKDGSLNREYCRFCYKEGQFTNPGFTLDEMKSHMFKMMEHEHLPADIVERAIKRLPDLKRWKKEIV